MKKPHHPIHNLGNFAHPAKAQTRDNSPKLMEKMAHGHKMASPPGSPAKTAMAKAAHHRKR